ncbi:hypothetical protein HZA73_01960 [candidate division TA06 bacterium]|nr:hypothetical protein [candidate division TA06 bacterium]
MSIITDLENRLLNNDECIETDRFIIRGIWDIKLLYQPNTHERCFKYNVLVVQTIKQGCCYYSGKRIMINDDLIGKDARTILNRHNCYFKIATLDSIYANFDQKCFKEYVLEGNSVIKSIKRAQIITNEIQYFIEEKNINNVKILNIGVVGNIINELVKKGCTVFATDLEPDIVGKKINGVTIENGHDKNNSLIDLCDIILVTGMALATNSLDEIVNRAKSRNKIIIVFAETGSWFGKYYCTNYQIDSVISESFPFYIFEGKSNIRIYRKYIKEVLNEE